MLDSGNDYKRDLDKCLKLLQQKEEFIKNAARVGNSLLEMNKALKLENEILFNKLEQYQQKSQNDNLKNKYLLDEKLTLEQQVNFYKNSKEELQKDLSLFMNTEQASLPLISVDNQRLKSIITERSTNCTFESLLIPSIADSLSLESVSSRLAKTPLSMFKNLENKFDSPRKNSAPANILLTPLGNQPLIDGLNDDSTNFFSSQTTPMTSSCNNQGFKDSPKTPVSLLKKQSKSALSRMVCLSVDGCNSPISRSSVGKSLQQVIESNDGTKNFSAPRYKSSYLGSPKLEQKTFFPEFVQENTNEIELVEKVLNEFLKLELGELFQPQKLFANLNLFQLRYGRKRKEFDILTKSNEELDNSLKNAIKQFEEALSYKREVIKLREEIEELKRGLSK